MTSDTAASERPDLPASPNGRTDPDRFAIELRGISKHFGPVRANDDVSLRVPAGTIHGIVGENGAGKSTLMSILYGFYAADAGEILVDGRQVHIRTTQDAIAAGIGMVHQHFMLVDNFTVLENIILGAEGGALLAPGLAKARARLQQIENDYALNVQLDQVIADLPVGLQQRVEILKALYRGARILILDEPTGVLTPQETERLFRIFQNLKAEGVTVILITHKLGEIMAVTDAVSVMRQGRIVAHRATAETSREELAELMVGRKVLLRVEKKSAEAGQPLLSVENIDVYDDKGIKRVDNVSFTLNAGEIVGIAGVSGNGQSELLEALSGIVPLNAGAVTMGAMEITPQRRVNARDTRQMQMAHVPEDRLRAGLIRTFPAYESYILGYHDDGAINGPVLLNRSACIADCLEKMGAYDVRPQNPKLKSANFSGGNQQKLVLAREMVRNPKILLVGQPTRGVDIGAIEFIHNSLIALRDAGAAILLVSVELDEIMSLSDRILVMFEGRVVGSVSGQEADERTLGLMMANAHSPAAGAAGVTA